MNKDTSLFQKAKEYHNRLPGRIRGYLHERGLLDSTIILYLLGWNGSRITIPVRDRDGQILFFRLAKNPDDDSDSPKVLSPPGSSVQLYGWERLHAERDEVVICEGEFDRLILEQNGFPAVTSTGGISVFKTEWTSHFENIPEIYICFDRDEAGSRGAKRVSELLPEAKVVELPEAVGSGGDVTDFFVELGGTAAEFRELLDQAEPLSPNRLGRKSNSNNTYTKPKSNDDKIHILKELVQIEDIIQSYVPLHRQGDKLVGKCPFHDDRQPSFVVYPETQSFYCFSCDLGGDVLNFLMEIEDLSFPQALEAVRKLAGEE